VSVTLDDVDLALLAALRDDGRASVNALAATVGVSRATAYSRLSRLESTGVITGYSARIDPSRAGVGIDAVILLNGGQSSAEPLRALLPTLPFVEQAYYVTGSADVVLVVRVSDVEELRDLVLTKIRDLPGIRATQTLLVLDQVVDRPFVLPAAATRRR
jgi:DNA-binding Lrp family transcriptional regulator